MSGAISSFSLLLLVTRVCWWGADDQQCQTPCEGPGKLLALTLRLLTIFVGKPKVYSIPLESFIKYNVSPHNIPTQNQGQGVVTDTTLSGFIARQLPQRGRSVIRSYDLCKRRQNLLLTYSKTLSVDPLGNWMGSWSLNSAARPFNYTAFSTR